MACPAARNLNLRLCQQGLEGLNGDIPSLSHVAQTLTQLQKEMHEFHISMIDIQERVASLEKHAAAPKCDKQEKVCLSYFPDTKLDFNVICIQRYFQPLTPLWVLRSE